MDVSIIIVNYNTVNIMMDAIDSVFEKTEGINYEIIVVDNNSSDNSESILSNKYSDKIKFIGLSENIGFGRANNKGVEVAKGRNILFLNPDTKLINNAVKILSDFLDSSPKVGACGGNLFDEEMKPADSFKRYFPSVFGEINQFLRLIPEKIFRGKNLTFNHKNKPLEVAFIFGADLMIKKSVLNDVGTFDPDFFMYVEETELCWRILQNDYKIMSVPDALIQHLEGGSFDNKKINEGRIAMQEKSRIIFFSKTHSKAYNLLAHKSYSILIYLNILIFTLYDKEKSKPWKIRLKKFRQSYNNYK